MKNALIIAVFALTAHAEPTLSTSSVLAPFDVPVDFSSLGRIDELALGQLERLGIAPANLCSDAVFVRRAYLDVIGTLPPAQEARSFINDKEINKRGRLIDALLDRDEFAEYWAMKWCDVLRVKAEFPINLWPNAVQAYHRWIRTSLAHNMPCDQFARELLTASGSNFRVPQVNFYRAIQGRGPEDMAKAVAVTFMGMRTDHWSPERLAGFSAFFAHVGYKASREWKEEIVFFDRTLPAEASGARETRAVFPDGTVVALTPERDPRAVLADWLVAADNPWFARHCVNRIWFWLLGRGLVHEPDDMRADNPPVNPELLDWLAGELVHRKYDRKHIFRLILNSKIYQLSSIPRSDHPLAEANFAFYPVRRLDAEVLIDALCQLTGTREEYSSAIPEPFTYVPSEQRSIALADGSITSSFLEMFGRSARDTGLLSERNNQITSDQRLQLLNSSHIRNKIEKGGALKKQLGNTKDWGQCVEHLYLAILSRPPTEAERKTVAAYRQSEVVRNPRDAAIDVAWALINSSEFLYRH